ncbi:MAG: ABC transporter ATP-binding protein [Flavobacteriales bacterium]|nr:MAG: ABC transporter ATP-binding protein [Flavobacteriales bacterium]
MSTTADTTPVIHARQLTKRFGDFTAVKGIDLDVRAGEIFGFLGANGAGKTVAMKMLIGLSKPSEGTARVAGFDVYTQSEEIKRSIGYMSQRFSLYNDLTVMENIRFYGGVYGLDNARLKQRADQLIADLGLEAHARMRLQDLPLGWKQKLAFSVALIHEPRIVFLDEPTGGVDPVTRRQFWEMIYAAAARGVTVFVTTHYMDEAEYCHRVSIMVDGVMAACDTPEALQRHYGGTMDEVFYQLARGSKRAE